MDILERMNNFKPKENKMIVDSEKLTELRRLRDEYQAKAEDMQRQIDEEIFNVNKIPDYRGQWMAVPEVNGPDTLWVGQVWKVQRLTDGVRVYYAVAMEVNGEDCVTLWTFGSIDNLHINFDIDTLENVEIITKEEAMKMICDKLEEFKNKINGADTKTE